MKRFISFLAVILAFFISVNGLQAQQSQLSNEVIWASGTFANKSVYGVRSMNNGTEYSSMDQEGTDQFINVYDYKSGKKKKTLAASKNLQHNGETIRFASYSFNATEKILLLTTEEEPIYRHSRKANYFVYEIKSKKLAPLTDFSKGKQSLASFSPDGKHIAFVRNNNLFYKQIGASEETQITTDGKWNEIINGAPDWVYEEEFGFSKGYHWSPEGSEIAYYRFDEREVPMFSMAMYGSLYPEQYTFKYPKAGETNSTVEIRVYNLAKNQNSVLNTGTTANDYIPRMQWTRSEGKLCVSTLNRRQNHLQHLVFDTQKPDEFEVLYEEKNDTYVEVNDDLYFTEDGKYFFLSSEKDGFNHIYRYKMNGKLADQVTEGNWDVTSFVGTDDKNEKVFFVSAETSPMQRNLYAIGFNGKGKKQLTQENGNNRAEFSKGFKYFINYNSGLNRPNKVTLHSGNGKLIKTLEENTKVQENMQKFGLVQSEFMTIPNENGDQMNAWMIKPSNFDANKAYPVLMYVYNGPGINTVNDSWGGGNYLWFQMLAQKGYIVVSVDARGTGYRGTEYKKCTYKQLGKLETEDQIAAAKWLGKQKYVDAARIGIFGWSYGGYMSSLCITKGADVFSTAIAVAPVTNWRYYDSIYTERYMQTPQENGAGYDDNSPISHVEKLAGKYLLVHGTADDNVHYQNSLEMTSALVNKNKEFDMFMYPNKNHGIYGGYTRLHLFNKMTNFILNNL